MKKKIAIIGDNHFTSGFRLIGVGETFTLPLDLQISRVKELISSGEYAVIFVSNSTYSILLDSFSEEVWNNECIIVPIPDIKNKMDNENLRQMVRKAIGVDMLGGLNE